MVIILITITGLILLDLLTKQLSLMLWQGQIVDVIKNVLQVTYYENRGASFGMLQDGGILLVLVSVIGVLIFSYLLYKEKDKFRISFYSLSLILFIAGAAGNLIDRAFYGYVIDWIHLPFLDYIIGSWNFVFNIADVYLNIAVVLMVIHLLFYSENKESIKNDENKNSN